MSDDCPDPRLQELFEVSQDHRHQDQGVKSFRIVVDPSQAVEPLFLPEGFEMSALRLLIGYGAMEAQDEIPGAIVIPQGYIIVLSNGRPPARSRYFGHRIRKITRPSSIHQGQPQNRRCNIVLQIWVETNCASLLLNGWAGLNPVGPSE